MNKFPNNFNKDSDFEKLKNELYTKNLRKRIYNHYVQNGDEVFFDITKDVKEMENINKVIDELKEIGFNVKKMFNSTALLIYLDEEKVKIWNNHLL